jgi:hypothetical protein
VWLEGLGKLKNPVTSLGIEPHDLPAQPTTLPCAPLINTYLKKIINYMIYY